MLRVSDLYLPGRCGLSAPWKVTNLPKIIDRKLCGGGFLGGKLGDDDGDEDNEAAEKLSCAQRLMEDKPAEEDGKDRFQTQNHAGKRGGDELLAKDLQRVAHAAGAHARVDDREPRALDSRPARMLQKEHGKNGNGGGRKELDAGQAHAV